jgi:GDP-L-fucose synthase
LKILITGAGGLVGRNLIAHPASAAYELHAPLRNELDLANAEGVAEYVQNLSPDLIIHAAGKVGGIQANLKDPFGFLVENLDIGRNLVLAAKNAAIPRLINLGSSCMYPKYAPNPLKEQQILEGGFEPTNEGYGLAKVAIAKMCEYVNRQEAALRYKTLIPCNLYGPGDKFDPASSHLIPAVIRKIHDAIEAGSENVEIWGDGTARREFMFVGDLAECVWKCVADFDAVPELMNVGLGFDYSVNEYYQEAADAMGFTGEFVHDLSKPVGMTQKLTCTEKANQWGWKANTSLRHGIEQTYQYFKESVV